MFPLFLYVIPIIVVGGAAVFCAAMHYRYQKTFQTLYADKAVLETSLAYAEQTKKELLERIAKQGVIEDQLKASWFEAQKTSELLAQQLRNLEEQQEAWKTDQQRHLDLTRASILQAGSEMSSKLLDDHKRESEVARAANEARIQQVTDKLHEQFKHISESIHTVQHKMTHMEVIERALLSPQGAGMLAEITLENIFKASGLIAEQDYYLQYAVGKQEDAAAVRPDAVVFLPGNQVMVVDSKASKFFMDMEQSEGEGTSSEAGLKQTMAQHLKDLIHRNYREAIMAHLEKIRPSKEPYQIIMMLFLPSESALERLCKIDRQFQHKAWENRIIPVGPSGLVNALLQSRQMIFCALQTQHSNAIMDDVKKLLASVATLYGLSEGLGKSIRMVFDKYDKFAASFNRNFLSKARKLHKQGIIVQDQSFLQQLERHQILSTSGLVEAEAIEEEESPVKSLEQLETLKTV